MISPKALVADLTRLVATLADDLPEQCERVPEFGARLQAQYAAAKDAGRTGEPFVSWREAQLVQAAAAWVLGCVFVRFLEDNRLIDEPLLSGPGERLGRARDRRTLYFQEHPMDSDREYLESVFRAMRGLPAVAALFDERHNPLWSSPLSGDAATRLLEFWQRVDPETGEIAHVFTPLDTRFLGDLYQDLSEAARKRYALLQTPEFVEEFILDGTLTPAIDEFGYREVRLIDPTCGSGHFLLGAYRRLFDLWARHEPAVNPRVLAQRALDQVHGVDLNPYAIAIARFRLLVAALESSGIERLKDAPGFRINVATGDSLVHGPNLSATRGPTPDLFDDRLRHHYATEDAAELRRILGQRYHAVVGNPPYITVKDKALNQAYRARYGSCHRQYSLAVPFMERFFELALPAESSPGHAGMITANSFMKREFGKKLIEHYIPRWDLTHVIDTSGAYIPGHGTPTVILFGRNRRPVADKVRAVMGIRGEPSTPEDPARGLVWTAIIDQVDRPGSESDYVSVADTQREKFHSHPWSIGGGGAAELKELLDAAGEKTLGEVVETVGFASFTGLDEAFVADDAFWQRRRMPSAVVREFIYGEAARDWAVNSELWAVAPYDAGLEVIPLQHCPEWARFIWQFRTSLEGVKSFGGKTRKDLGDDWWAWYRWVPAKYRTPLSIAFAFVATHNHFVLDRGGKVFNRSAPVIKLPPEATEEDHLALLGLLNSSVACFWMKQVMTGKHKGDGGTAHADPAYQRFEFDGSKLQQLPVTDRQPLGLSGLLYSLASATGDNSTEAMAESQVPTRTGLDAAHVEIETLRSRMIALQEELDWECYRLYGLVDEDFFHHEEHEDHEEGASPSSGLSSSCPSCPSWLNPPPIHLGERAFEIVMARKMAAGELDTAWFERHGSTPLTEIPTHWPEEYRRVVERRIRKIESDRNIALIERPEYKRRWNTEPWEQQVERALRGWLLDRLERIPGEATEGGTEPALTTCARLADVARRDADFMQVAELYRGRSDFDVTALVTELVEGQSVPFLPVLRYKASGLRKRAAWEETWALQRAEDLHHEGHEGHEEGTESNEAFPLRDLRALRGEEIPVPPKYTSADFLKTTFWRLRGKLDVPKERFVSYPHCEREADPTPVVAWAGWDHLQQARALAAYYIDRKENDGWSAERLTPLLAGLLDLEPWLLQWHNEVDPTYGVGMGDYFRDFTREEARALGLTVEEIRGWTPPARARSRRRKRAG